MFTTNMERYSINIKAYENDQRRRDLLGLGRGRSRRPLGHQRGLRRGAMHDNMQINMMLTNNIYIHIYIYKHIYVYIYNYYVML